VTGGLRTIVVLSVLFAVLAGSLGLMLWASLTDAPIGDEVPHIAAGYAYVTSRDFRLNPEHPPLVKALALLPLAWADLTFPADHSAYVHAVNGEWDTGIAFLYGSGNDPDAILQRARFVPISLALGLVGLTYLWAVELMGAVWALLPAGFLAFSPLLLSHGHYVTTDVGGALGVLLAIYLFVRALRVPTRGRVLMAGCGFGIAQLTKFSALLLMPHFLLVAGLFVCLGASAGREESGSRSDRRILGRLGSYGGVLLAVLAIGAGTVWAGYAYFMSGYSPAKQHADTAALLACLTTEAATAVDSTGILCPSQSDSLLARGRRGLAHLTVWASDRPVLRGPAHYTLGVIMTTGRVFGANYSYLLGDVAFHGHWYYFPVLFLTKEPLASLAALALGFGWYLFTLSARRGGRGAFQGTRLAGLRERPAEVALGTFILLYWAVILKSSLNIGVRHLLPAIPAMYLLGWSAVRTWARSLSMRGPRGTVLAMGVLGVLIVGHVAPVLVSAPLFLSSYNLLGGGDARGYRIAIDSNYDWGQDLKRLARWVETRNSDHDPTNDVTRIAVDYVGGGSPRYYLGDRFVRWDSTLGDPSASGLEYLAVSVSILQTRTARGRSPEGRGAGYVGVLDPRAPYDRAGMSLFIYRFVPR
jgi:dolichyl-phosphate-mannose-protein mannosyltransferase